ncbi:MAG: methionyl-tRNA formyltransferase [Hyphomonas sp.]
MALIRKLEQKHMDRNSIHEEIEASYTVFERDGRTFLQIDSYGRTDREIPGKKSQTIQLDEVGAAQLYSILESSFGFK